MDGGDVGVVECGQKFGFSVETSEAFRVLGEGLGEDLDGDVAFKASVECSIDFAHSTSSDQRDDLVVSQGSTRGKKHRFAASISRVQRGRTENPGVLISDGGYLLDAHFLRFLHPITGDEIHLEAPLPPGPLTATIPSE